MAGVVEALRASGEFTDVVVVDDGSSDSTASVAERAGALVIQTPRNLGKGGAMLFAYAGLPDDPDDRIAFFDADLLGLAPAHVRAMSDVSSRGFDMVSLRMDRSAVSNLLQSFGSLITGQRILRRWVLDALPQTCWSGYCIETAMNDVVRRNRGKSAIVVLPGVRPRTKLDKIGVVAGIRGQVRMAKQIARTRRALRSSDGMKCEL